MRTYKYNWGKLLFLRFLLVGWTLQGIHSLDRTEKILRIVLEVFITAFTVLILSTLISSLSGSLILICLVIVHTLFWICDSGWLTGMRECFGFIKNRGLNSTIDYLEFTKKIVEASATADAILVYGSLCRKEFHERSDLDLRIVRKLGVGAAIKLFLLCILLRFCGMYRFGVLLDLRIVDTIAILAKKMRNDEQPIVVFCAPGFNVPNPGEAYETLKHEPYVFLKKVTSASS